MQTNIQMLLILCPLVFLAGFVDSIAGGGGLISLPSYLLIGLPPHTALGTNKFSSCIGTLIATIRYTKNRQVHYKSALTAAVCALFGSYCGALLALAFDEKFLKVMLVVLLPVMAIITLKKKKFGEENRISTLSDRKIFLLSSVTGLVIGTYDGFFGPGTGTFLVLAFAGILRLDLATASGNTKIVNLASNIAALTAFIRGNSVMFSIAVPAAICCMLGNWLGSGLAVKNGAKVIRPVFVGVLILLFGKVVWELFVQ